MTLIIIGGFLAVIIYKSEKHAGYEATNDMRDASVVPVPVSPPQVPDRCTASSLPKWVELVGDKHIVCFTKSIIPKQKQKRVYVDETTGVLLD